jgi:hypothetical protein
MLMSLPKSADVPGNSAEVSNAHFSILGSARVDLPIERVDDVGGRVLGCADAGPSSEPQG